jgi:hypothetical protein
MSTARIAIATPQPKPKPKYAYRKIGEAEGSCLLEKHAPYWREHLFHDDEVLYRVIRNLSFHKPLRVRIGKPAES